jgi:hypothetical protein
MWIDWPSVVWGIVAVLVLFGLAACDLGGVGSRGDRSRWD